MAKVLTFFFSLIPSIFLQDTSVRFDNTLKRGATELAPGQHVVIRLGRHEPLAYFRLIRLVYLVVVVFRVGSYAKLLFKDLFIVCALFH